MARSRLTPDTLPETAPVAIHYVGDGTEYVIGLSIDPTVTSYVAPELAAGLVAGGLFALGEAPAQEGEPA